MKLGLALVAGLWAVASCSSDTSADGSTLIGVWADASGARVVATPSGMLYTLACRSTVRVNHAVRFDPSGSFVVMDSLRGTIDGSERDTLPGHPIIAAKLTGSLVGDRLTILLERAVAPAGVPNGGGMSAGFDGRLNQEPGSTICRS